MCDAMPSKAQAQMAQAGVLFGQAKCEKVMAAAIALGGEEELKKLDPEKIKLTHITIRGTHATAEVTPSTDGDPTSRYVKEDGEWKLDADPEEDASSSSTSTSAGDEDATAERPAPSLTVAERGFTRTGDGAIYGAVIRNDGADDAVGVEVQVNLLGAGRRGAGHRDPLALRRAGRSGVRHGSAGAGDELPGRGAQLDHRRVRDPARRQRPDRRQRQRLRRERHPAARRAAVELGGLDELRSAERADIYVDGETSERRSRQRAPARREIKPP